MKAVKTTIGYKTEIKIFVILFIYIPLHGPVCRDYRQVAYEYVPVLIELSIKMDQF
jgi:hypothetical protein